MHERLFPIELTNHATRPDKEPLMALESGGVIYFPKDAFQPTHDEKPLLSESILHPKHKNLSYDFQKNRLAGLNPSFKNPALMSTFMHRFALYAETLIKTTLPHYADALIWGRTSYRPAQIKNRKTSPRKDDTRVHVDAFSATPVNGLRILRVFCNINPDNAPRVWELGESFPQVLDRFATSVSPYRPFMAKLLHHIYVTKTRRSPYDHFMLQLHDRMKLDTQYQDTLSKTRIEFPANSTWVVFTDSVSHAALGGQYLMEQTFYLPVSSMVNPALSPYQQWEARAL